MGADLYGRVVVGYRFDYAEMYAEVMQRMCHHPEAEEDGVSYCPVCGQSTRLQRRSILNEAFEQFTDPWDAEEEEEQYSGVYHPTTERLGCVIGRVLKLPGDEEGVILMGSSYGSGMFQLPVPTSDQVIDELRELVKPFNLPPSKYPPTTWFVLRCSY